MCVDGPLDILGATAAPSIFIDSNRARCFMHMTWPSFIFLISYATVYSFQSSRGGERGSVLICIRDYCLAVIELSRGGGDGV